MYLITNQSGQVLAGFGIFNKPKYIPISEYSYAIWFHTKEEAKDFADRKIKGFYNIVNSNPYFGP